jgi:heme A synthase
MRFAKTAWAILGITLLVVLWGAYVRASGSGAGCGSHWPLCNGEVVPRAAQTKTLIELSHRVTSGISMILVFAQTVWALRAFPRGSIVRKASAWASVFMLGEVLIGALLVLFKLVEHDASIQRALSMALHLVNTFFLVGALATVAWWSSGKPAPRARLSWLLAMALGLVLLVGTSGAVAALGDTLFPARSLREGLEQDLSLTAHVFVRLRALHPFVAVVGGFALVGAAALARKAHPTRDVSLLARAVTLVFVAQVALGLLNVSLLAPIWLQLVHLMVAQLLWIALVLLSAASVAEPVVEESSPTCTARSPSSPS